MSTIVALRFHLAYTCCHQAVITKMMMLMLLDKVDEIEYHYGGLPPDIAAGGRTGVFQCKPGMLTQLPNFKMATLKVLAGCL